MKYNKYLFNKIYIDSNIETQLSIKSILLSLKLSYTKLTKSKNIILQFLIFQQTRIQILFQSNLKRKNHSILNNDQKLSSHRKKAKDLSKIISDSS